MNMHIQSLADGKVSRLFLKTTFQSNTYIIATASSGHPEMSNCR